eukprot:scaffold415927_cov17-Prasinocladus_malaysianus.AAC.2
MICSRHNDVNGDFAVMSMDTLMEKSSKWASAGQHELSLHMQLYTSIIHQLFGPCRPAARLL